LGQAQIGSPARLADLAEIVELLAVDDGGQFFYRLDLNPLHRLDAMLFNR
jgi:hypothetical protein